MRGKSPTSVVASPVLVGAVTVLIVVVGVMLAYNANNGLPFVPTIELKAMVPNGAKLVQGNEVREGGFRVGIVSEIESVRLADGTAGAELTLKLDQKAGPIPADSSVRVRPRSALGLKYVELQRGSAADTLPDGATIVSAGGDALAPELQEFFDIFDERTRENVQRNLEGYGDGLAFRGLALNRALAELPRLTGSLPPVMRVLSSREARLERLFAELEDAARVSAPLAETIADGFAAAADTFGALAQDPAALDATIAESPATLAVATRSLRAQRPFLRSLASVSTDLRTAAAELRRSATPLASTLRSGIRPLRGTPALNRRLGATFDALRALAASPNADRGAGKLDESARALNPLLRYLGPFVTVCNNWNYTWTFLADHITDKDSTGQIQRVQAKSPDDEQQNLDAMGQGNPIPGLHIQQYNAAIDDQGNADCETGQRGFPRHLARGLPSSQPIVLDPDTPGSQGPTFRGRPRVLEGQTYSRLPEGAPPVPP